MTVKDQPVDSDAARDLVKRVHECEDVLYVIAIGEITNVASAILMDPEIIKKMVVIWLSGQRYTGRMQLSSTLDRMCWLPR